MFQAVASNIKLILLFGLYACFGGILVVAQVECSVHTMLTIARSFNFSSAQIKKKCNRKRRKKEAG